MARRNAAAAVLVAGLTGTVLLGACADDGASEAAPTTVTHIPLDGSARRPDDAGVLTDVDPEFSFIVLDGETTYDLSDTVQSFASLDGSTQPLVGRLGQYVQVGLDGDTVVWVASLGAVLRLPDQPEHVLYLGKLVAGGAGEITLQDGTVLTLGDGVEVPGSPTPDDPIPAVLTIDVSSDAVVAVQPG